MLTMRRTWKHTYEKINFFLTLDIRVAFNCCFLLTMKVSSNADTNWENCDIEWENKQSACSMEIVYNFLIVKHQHVFLALKRNFLISNQQQWCEMFQINIYKLMEKQFFTNKKFFWAPFELVIVYLWIFFLFITHLEFLMILWALENIFDLIYLSHKSLGYFLWGKMFNEYSVNR